MPAKALVQRKAEKRQLLARHKEELKSDVKKNMVFSFVKQSYIS